MIGQGKSRSSGAIRVITCLGVDLELPHLRHFLAHYMRLGVAARHIHLIANTTDPKAVNLAAATQILEEMGAPPPKLWIAAYTSDLMWQERRNLQARVARPGDWIINADIDEHHAYPVPLPDLVSYCERRLCNCVQGFLIDRLAPGGALSPVVPTPELAEQYPLRAEVHLSLVGRGRHHGIDGTTKLMLHRHDVLPSRGGHNPSAEGAAPRFLAGAKLARHPRASDPAFRFAFPFRVDHYKWTATRERTFRRRIVTPGVSKAGLEVGGKMARYLAEHGRIRPQDVSVAPTDVPRARPGWKLLCLRMRLVARLSAVRGWVAGGRA